VFIRRMPKYSYFVIFMTCLLPSLYSIWDERVNGNVWTIQDRLVWIFLAGIAATVICRLLWRFTKEAERKSIHEFFDTMRTPVDYAKEVGKSLDYKQLFFLGNTVPPAAGAQRLGRTSGGGIRRRTHPCPGAFDALGRSRGEAQEPP